MLSCSSQSGELLEESVVQFHITDQNDEDMLRLCYLHHWELTAPLCVKLSK